MENCGQFHVWSDAGYANETTCFYALWHALDTIVEQYPNATIVLNKRNVTTWLVCIHPEMGQWTTPATMESLSNTTIHATYFTETRMDGLLSFIL